MTGDIALALVKLPAETRNGLPWKPYTYRGTGQDTVTAGIDFAVPPEPAHRGRRPARPCGTTAAYKRHIRRGEKPCEECRQAEKRRHADWPGRDAYNEARRQQRQVAA